MQEILSTGPCRNIPRASSHSCTRFIISRQREVTIAKRLGEKKKGGGAEEISNLIKDRPRKKKMKSVEGGVKKLYGVVRGRTNKISCRTRSAQNRSREHVATCCHVAPP